MARKKKSDVEPPAFEEPQDAGAPAGPAAHGDPIETPTLFSASALEAPAAAQRAPAGCFISPTASVKQLLAARQQIDALLPPRNIAEIDLEEELILQYYLAKAMMQEASTNEGTPANQKAQVLNSCAAVLKTLADVQTALYTAESFKVVQQVLEKVWAPEEADKKRAFFERYARMVREAAAQKDAKKQQFVRIYSEK